MEEREAIHIWERLCDLCGDKVTEGNTATKSFVLTDWGVICVECWDDKIERHEDFDIVHVYATSQYISDDWIRMPMIFAYGGDKQ